jgi:hypothetical protein
MTTIPVSTDVQLKRVYQIAQEYRARGYRVFVGPSQAELPDFLRGFEPDLMALHDDDNVVVEVKRRMASPDSDSLVRMATVIEGRPEWRLELVVLPMEQEPEEALPSTSDREHIAELIRHAQALGDSPYAIVPACLALEYAMLLAAQREQLDLADPPYASAVLKTLFAYGIISYDDYQKIEQAMDVRNDVAHRGKPLADVQAWVKTIETMITELIP